MSRTQGSQQRTRRSEPLPAAPASFGEPSVPSVSLDPPLCPRYVVWLEPEDELRRTQRCRALEVAAIARVVLHRDLERQVALNRVAAADLDAPHRRIPRKRAGGG